MVAACVAEIPGAGNRDVLMRDATSAFHKGLGAVNEHNDSIVHRDLWVALKLTWIWPRPD